MTTATDDRVSWLAMRRLGVGASDVAAICGLPDAYGSRWSVWASKVGLTPLDDTPSPSMQFGRDVESVIAAWFERQTGLCVRGEQTVVRHADEPRWFATVDGFVVESSRSEIGDALGVFEAKYTRDAPWSEPPPRYVAQVQWQLAVSGLASGWLAAMHLPYGRPEFRVYEIERDDAVIAEQIRTVSEFWSEHVVTGIAPPVDASDATHEAIKTAWGSWPTTKAPTVDFDAHARLVGEYALAKSTLKRAESEERQLGDQIRVVFGDSLMDWMREFPDLDAKKAPSEGTLGGRLAVSWRSQTRDNGVDVKAVRADHGDRYDKAPSTYRVLRLHSEEGETI